MPDRRRRAGGADGGRGQLADGPYRPAVEEGDEFFLRGAAIYMFFNYERRRRRLP